MKMKRGEIYFLRAPAEGEEDLARPGFWDDINFDAAPFLLMDIKKSGQDSVYTWGEWVLFGYVESMEHSVPPSEINFYEERWELAEDDRLLNEVKDVIRINSLKAIKLSEGGSDA